MKVRHLVEVFEYSPPEAKLKKVKSMLTPENIAQHYETVCIMLAHVATAKDLDQLKAQLDGGPAAADDVDFNLKMLAKALTPIAKDVKREKDYNLKAEVVSGKLDQVAKLVPVHGGEPGETAPVKFGFGFNVGYIKAKWQVSHSKVGQTFGWTSKRLESPAEALAYLKQQMQKYEKLRTEVEAHNKKLKP